MTRVATTNYSATTSTQFQWATADSDVFDRELDLYRLSQALEFHDHTATRGVSVGRIAANIVAETNLQDNSVATNKLQASAVTQAKLASSSVSRDKLVQPWVQAANNHAGGLTLRDSSSTYDVSFFIAGNGLSVFGVGPSGGSILGLLTLNYNANGLVSIGPASGAGRFNVFQTDNNYGGGVRLYNTDTTFFSDLVNDVNHNLVIANSGSGSFWVGAGRVCVGNNAANFTARLNIEQSSGANTEGFYSQLPTLGTVRIYVDPSGHAVLTSSAAAVRLEAALGVFSPLVAGGTNLGKSGHTWGELWCTTISASGAVSFASTVGVSGLLTASAGITTGGNILPSSNNTLSLGSPSATYNNVHSGVVTTYGTIQPSTNATQENGGVSNQWSHVWSNKVYVVMSGAGSTSLQVGIDSAGKPSTNTWTVTSDSRTKIQESVRDYVEGLEKVLKLRPIFYRYNGLASMPAPDDQEEDSIGFLAEEALEAAPELVKALPGKLRPEDDEETDILHVNTHALSFMFVNAFKEITARIEALEARN